MATGNKLKLTPFWLIVIFLLFVIGGIVLFGDLIPGRQAPAVEAQPPSVEFTAAPEEGVDVDLPDTPLRASPGQEDTPEAVTEDEQQ